MKLKEIKDKTESLSFFVNFVEISKIRVLQLLNNEVKKLNNIQGLKAANLNLLNAIEERWFTKRGISFFDRKLKKEKETVNIYFIVDPKKIDAYSSNMLNKMEEKLSETVTKNDFIVTFGIHVNTICQKLELNIIEHFDYSAFEDAEELSEKMSALIEIGIKNNLFNKVIMMIAQSSNSQSEPIIRKQILPFEPILTKSILENDLLDNGEQNKSKIENIENIENYKNVISNINIGKAEWNPDVFVFHEQFSKTIIKQSIHELKVISKVEQYNLELQLLEEKKNKLSEQQELMKMLYNRVRKEESTMQSLLLYSAFKLREEEEEFPLVKIKGSVE